jgi:hypothetical protein
MLGLFGTDAGLSHQTINEFLHIEVFAPKIIAYQATFRKLNRFFSNLRRA